jgi:RNA polymerase sigma factor (sigma-70 family)
VTNELLNLDPRSEYLLRELAPQVLGAVIRRFHDFATAEDAVQEALMAAVVQWPREGVPDNPRRWLIHVASRRMTDHVRIEMARRRRESELALEAVTATAWTAIETAPEEDDTLVLLFMCCHPALTLASAIALTLRAVGGLTTAEIAHAFLVPEATMAQRISRATSKASRSLAFHSNCRLPRSARNAYALHYTSCTSFSMRVTRVAPDLTCSEATFRVRRCA